MRLDELQRIIDGRTPGDWRMRYEKEWRLVYTPQVLTSSGGILFESTSHGNMRVDTAYVATMTTVDQALLAVAVAAKGYLQTHRDCYCDCNSGSCPCAPCQMRKEKIREALEVLSGIPESKP
jgi:hypothetical protein